MLNWLQFNNREYCSLIYIFKMFIIYSQCWSALDSPPYILSCHSSSLNYTLYNMNVTTSTHERSDLSH